jgi:mannose-6-phosphate isomerase-like protein (cupin superfamily)
MNPVARTAAGSVAVVLALAVFAPSFLYAQAKPRPAAGLTVRAQVTDHSGNPLGDVSVTLSGPVERTGATAQDGTVLFRTIRPGTYRLRFEREQFTTLERELTVRAQSADVSVALTAAPDKPAPPPPAPVAPAPPAPRPARVVEPRSLSIPDFLDRDLIGSEPQKVTTLACMEGGTARLVQVRDPLTDQLHDDVDELLYVVAGSGIIRIRNQDSKVAPGHFVLIPRTVPHAIRKDGRNPVILLSVFAGTPCTE